MAFSEGVGTTRESRAVNGLLDMEREVRSQWSAASGVKGFHLQPKRNQAIDEQYPLPTRGGADLAQGDRVMATTLMAFELVRAVAVVDDIDALLEDYLAKPSGLEGASLSERLVTEDPALAKKFITRRIVEERVQQKSLQAAGLDSYDAKIALSKRTNAYNENNVPALAAIHRMYRSDLIGSVTRGRSEAIIRLMLEDEPRPAAVESPDDGLRGL